MYNRETEEQRNLLCSKCLQCVGCVGLLLIWGRLIQSYPRIKQTKLANYFSKKNQNHFCVPLLKPSLENCLRFMEGKGIKLALLCRHGLLDMSSPYGWVRN